MNNKHYKIGAGPIIVFALVFALMFLILPTKNIYGLLASFITAAALAFADFIRKKNKLAAEHEKELAEKPVQELKDERLAEIETERNRAQAELGRLYHTIKNETVKTKIIRIMELTDRILLDAKDDPADIPQIKKFMNYYLPTTIKLLNAYDRMDTQGIAGSNINKSRQSIEEMLDTAIEAYRKQLDSLFENQSLDIETDIQVMNTMLAREGLVENKDFKLKEGV